MENPNNDPNNEINNEPNNNPNNEPNNSLYDDLNIYEEQNNINIESVYFTSYLNYKKKLFTSCIEDDFKLIASLFDENICDILINIFILKKKNKISEKQFIMFKFIFDYAEKINNIVFLDSENFLFLLMDLYKLYKLCTAIDAFFENYIFKDLINYKMITSKIMMIYKKLCEKILLFKIYDELNEINDPYVIKNKIIYLAKKISFDLFMFYDSQSIFLKILNSFTHIKNFYIDISHELNNMNELNNIVTTVDENKNLLKVFEINKINFIKEYDESAKKYFDIYSNDIELYIKFKIGKIAIIEKFIENITYIKNI